MAVKIRLKRVGTTKKALWRVVVADSRMPRDGRFIEEVGTYDPMKDPAVVSLNADRVRYWVSKGAKPSETVQNLMKTKGL
ncbi:MAG: 30S ribosomal protein S16 [Omnitrophica bacterium RIFCSPLOWO2_12_FULL_44_17]|uniref:Small ribosomal subunit protein bS16 n=1 Tax=Candidatus Danuiimicrobium aquiferis TaxID=1801832 RepID=A0A1G1KWU8_9BACT|nr:MAG: 30S ribosomal protein S16 [Omnitrophica bacterium RIFCSPHIGHO2_02_FULL_45_28]OGW91051.1 MAG: 30S ribosomal protein S16 [Omnitrophica bacterium RIFCSPHIGHO2_12_FULL_44_12]OGW97403.1 MAG: 30S ribosomal protein S16 [Omnitrophica bacterium RIFCSPLOWO2_12_FULL_44_17]OGX04477.1 MAG: 30S ribosomal protein S16 [Omnitrophica bacterium RIFCSPLOWO2_02_FULL_44_11]